MKSAYETFAPIYTWMQIKQHEKSAEHKAHILESQQLCEHTKRHLEETSWGNYISVCDSCHAVLKEACEHVPTLMENSSGREGVYCARCEQYLGE